MVDLHTHTTFSDGVLIPYELTRRALVKGIEFLAFTDHGDFSNMEFIITSVKKAVERINSLELGIKVIAGIELTHIPPDEMQEAVLYAKRLGAELIVAHGETIVEPVACGTNRAAILAGVDILAHPGLITEEDVKLAAEMGVFLEISGRKGHSFTNGHVAKLAKKYNAKLVFNTDSHAPSDLMDKKQALSVLMGCGLSLQEAIDVINNGFNIAKSIVGGRL